MEYIGNNWHHDCSDTNNSWVDKELKICSTCSTVQPYPFTIDTMKRTYNWFHTAFPTYQTNKMCTSDDILLRNDFEGWIVDCGQ